MVPRAGVESAWPPKMIFSRVTVKAYCPIACCLFTRNYQGDEARAGPSPLELRAAAAEPLEHVRHKAAHALGVVGILGKFGPE